MENGGPAHGVDSGLLGVEIGRNKVRLVLLDWQAGQLIGAVERPIAKAGGPRDPIEQEFSTRSAIEAGLDRLDLDIVDNLLVGATIGFPNCGVGSGPALEEWLESLSAELDEPIFNTGTTGISYAPASCVEFVHRVFEPTGLRLNRIDLAPVAAARVISSIRSGAIALGSGVAWSARLLNNQVLEAFETVDGGFEDELQVMINGVGQRVERLEGFEIDQSFGPARGISVAALAPAVGVAVALHDRDGPNLLTARQTGRVDEPVAADQVVEHATSRGGSSGVAVAAGADQAVDTWAPPATAAPEQEIDIPGPPPIDSHVERAPDAAFAERYDPHLDDLGSIQDELRAHRVDDTHQLRRLPRSIERSRELRTPSPRSPERTMPPVHEEPQPRQEFEHIEAFAHADEPAEGFHVSDFLLGALLMLAIVLAIALVVL